MKSKTIKGILFIVFITLLAAWQQKKEEPVTPVVDKDQIKKEIQAMENAYADAYNDRNLDAVVYYADEAITYSQNAPALVSKYEIDKYMMEDIKTFPKGCKLSNTTTEVHVSNDGNQVVEVGLYKVTDSTKTVIRSGNFISLFEKRDGKYICIRDMEVSNMPKTDKK